MESREQIALLVMLLNRLERIPPDSRWAHRASGIRGALLKRLEQFETGGISRQETDQLMERGFWLLQKAAEEK